MPMSSPFQAEPAFTHGQPPKTAVILCNLGTPEAPTPNAVRTYLSQFLSDARVVEIPRLLWMLILHGIILRVRPAKSAAKYASIWTAQGSPLRLHTAAQAAALQLALEQRGHRVAVAYAMRYGAPALATVLDQVKAAGAVRVLVLPAYPQYSATTTASVFDAVYAWAAKVRNIPELRFVNRYHDHPSYIAALAAHVQAYWAQHGRPDKLVMSFHGVPERTLQLGDPYHCECLKTGRLLAEQLQLQRADYQVTFQSRFGRAKWLEPYTEPTLQALAKDGVGRVDVVCPGFTGDCLETLEEIAMEGKAAFITAGGKVFNYIACLNSEPAWIQALADIATLHMGGWPTQTAPDAAALAAQRDAALGLGAQR
jgi:protoporphyrin/coproporphyrin ferrochelatase